MRCIFKRTIAHRTAAGGSSPKRPPHLTSRARSMPVHDAAKPDVREDHGDLAPANQQGCKRSFCDSVLNGVHLFAFEQCPRQVAEFSVVLDDQYGSTALLRLPYGWAPPSVRRDRPSIGARAPPGVAGAASKRPGRKRSATLPQALTGTSFDPTVPWPDGASRRVLR
jgi:hypothetical protein